MKSSSSNTRQKILDLGILQILAHFSCQDHQKILNCVLDVYETVIEMIGYQEFFDNGCAEILYSLSVSGDKKIMERAYFIIQNITDEIN